MKMQNVSQLQFLLSVCTKSRVLVGLTFFPVKAEIEEKKIVEISTSNTLKSRDSQGKSRFFRDITLPEISTVEISGGNKNLIFEKFGSRRCVLHLESIS